MPVRASAGHARWGSSDFREDADARRPRSEDPGLSATLGTRLEVGRTAGTGPRRMSVRKHVRTLLRPLDFGPPLCETVRATANMTG